METRENKVKVFYSFSIAAITEAIPFLAPHGIWKNRTERTALSEKQK